MAEKAKIDLVIEGAQGAKTLGELRDNAVSLEEALEGAALNSEDFKKLSAELIKVNTEVKNLELGFEALDKEQVASELGGVAGAIGDITTATILLGGENETLEIMAQNIEKALAASMALKGGMEGLASARKLLNNQISKGTKIGKIATAVQKAFNVVMRANPIGLIVTAIVLLIAGLVLLSKNVKSVGDFFVSLGAKIHSIIEGMGAWKNVILILLGPIGLLIAAWDFFFGEQAAALDAQMRAEQAAFEERTRRGKEIAKLNQARLDEIKKLAAAEQEAFDNRQEIFDLDIARMDAEGQNSDALKRAKIQDQLEHEQFVLESINTQIASWEKYYEDLFVMSGKSREDFITQLKGQGIDVLALQEESLQLIAEQNKKVFSAETELIAFNRNVRIKNAKDSNKEIIAATKDFMAEMEKLETAFLERNLGNQVKQENAVRDKYFTIIELAKENNQDVAILEEAREQELFDIREKFRIQEAEIIAEVNEEFAEQEEAALQKKQDAQSHANNVAKQGAKDLFNVAQSLLKKRSDKDLKAAQEKVARGEKLTNAEIKRLKRQDKIQKAFALAQIAADTARGVSAAIAAGAGLPFPANLGAIASGIAAVLAGAAQAAGVLGESAEIPQIDIPSATDFSDTETTAQNVPTINEAAFGSTLLNEPQEVFVVESNITDSQNSVGVIEAQATFG